MRISHPRSGFKLMDLAVVLTIGVICFGVFFSQATIRAFLASGPLGALLPSSGKVRDDSKPQTINHLRYLSLASHSHNDVYKTLPPAFVSPQTAMGPRKITTWPSGLEGTCHVGLGPYFENNADLLINPPDYSFKSKQHPWPINILAPFPYCSQSANFYLFGGPDPEVSNGAGPYTPLAVHTIKDGSSNTIMFVTTLACYANGASKIDQDPTQPTAPFTASLTWNARPALPQQGTALANANGYTESAIAVALADGSARHILLPGGPDTAYGNAMLPCDGKLPEWDY